MCAETTTDNCAIAVFGNFPSTNNTVIFRRKAELWHALHIKVKLFPYLIITWRGPREWNTYQLPSNTCRDTMVQQTGLKCSQRRWNSNPGIARTCTALTERHTINRRNGNLKRHIYVSKYSHSGTTSKHRNLYLVTFAGMSLPHVPGQVPFQWQCDSSRISKSNYMAPQALYHGV